MVKFGLLRRLCLDDMCESVKHGCSMQIAWLLSGVINMTLPITGLTQRIDTTSNLMTGFIVFNFFQILVH